LCRDTRQILELEAEVLDGIAAGAPAAELRATLRTANAQARAKIEAAIKIAGEASPEVGALLAGARKNLEAFEAETQRGLASSATDPAALADYAIVLRQLVIEVRDSLAKAQLLLQSRS